MWRWSRREPPLAISTHPVLRRERPILLVIHQEDDSWQFLDGGNFNVDEGAALHTHHLFDDFPEVRVLADLPCGWAAERADEGAPWDRYPWPDDAQ